MVIGVPCMCMMTTPAPAAATTPDISGSPRRPVTSLTISAPALSAASATTAFDVSTDIKKSPLAARSPCTTGSTRANSSATGTGLAPGLVDSPPTSSTPAPLETICRPRRIAASGVANEPPSEKESGVTLRTPMIHPRRERSWSRPRIFQIIFISRAEPLISTKNH